MADFAVEDGQIFKAVGGTTLTSGALLTATSAGYKGPYSQISTGLQYMSNIIGICVDDNSAATDYFLDIAVGAAGSEVVIIPNVLIGCSRANQSPNPFIMFPINIPANTPISGRVNSGTLNATINVHLIYSLCGLQCPSPFSQVVTYGNLTTSVTGTQIAPSATINMETTYFTTITTGSTSEIRGIILGAGQRRNTAQTSARWHIDIGIGATGVEQTIIADLPMGTNTTSDQMTPQIWGPFMVNIPSGTRIGVRAKCSINDATDKLFDAVLYCLR